eukprot:5408825-Lingulodinium_polyedra.AAC.1
MKRNAWAESSAPRGVAGNAYFTFLAHASKTNQPNAPAAPATPNQSCMEPYSPFARPPQAS